MSELAVICSEAEYRTHKLPSKHLVALLTVVVGALGCGENAEGDLGDFARNLDNTKFQALSSSENFLTEKDTRECPLYLGVTSVLSAPGRECPCINFRSLIIVRYRIGEGQGDKK